MRPHAAQLAFWLVGGAGAEHSAPATTAQRSAARTGAGVGPVHKHAQAQLGARPGISARLRL